jgi:Fic family protein
MTDRFPRISQLQKALAEKLPLKEEDQKRLDSKFRLEFTFNSNHMEGNTLTYGQTKLLLFFDQTDGNHNYRDFEEMKAHDVALQLIKNWSKESDERPLTEQAIRQLNEIILVRPFWKEAITPSGETTRREIQVGDYKSHPNSVRLPNGELFEYASPQETPALMGELVGWYRKSLEEGTLHPVELAALLHYKFVRIHPFDDGNGRVARLLMNYVLYCFELPPVVIKSSDKKRYLQALNRADAGNEQAFVDYIAQQLEWSLELSLKAADGQSVEEEDDLDKQISLLGRELAVGQVLGSEGTVQQKLKALKEEICPFLIDLDSKTEKAGSFFVSRSVENFSISDLVLFVPGFIALSPYPMPRSPLPYSRNFHSLKDLTIFLESIDERQIVSLDLLEFNWKFNFLKNSIDINNSLDFKIQVVFERIRYCIQRPDQRSFKAGYGISSNSARLEELSNEFKREIQTQVLKLAGKL